MKTINIRTANKASRGVNGGRIYKTDYGFGLKFTAFRTEESRREEIVQQVIANLNKLGLKFHRQNAFGLFIPAIQD